MSFRRALLMGAFASLALFAAGVDARADYTFSTSSGGTKPFDTASNLILTGQPTSQALNFSSLINIQDVEDATTTPAPNNINVSVPFTFTITINSFPGTQPASTGTGTSTASGSINFTRSDVGGEVSTLVSLTIPSIVIGGTTYSFSNPTYAGPTVNSAPNSLGAGNLSITINPSNLVPEPASLAMMGTGLAGVLGLGLRRRKAMA